MRKPKWNIKYLKSRSDLINAFSSNPAFKLSRSLEWMDLKRPQPCWSTPALLLCQNAIYTEVASCKFTSKKATIRTQKIKHLILSRRKCAGRQAGDYAKTWCHKVWEAQWQGKEAVTNTHAHCHRDVRIPVLLPPRDDRIFPTALRMMFSSHC